jgi:sterol desaturase/sphingolipid hydroxylase (fatty acid hydroxylase superfamily)
VQFLVALLAAGTWDRLLLGWPGGRPWSLRQADPLVGAAVGYFVITFVYYWWHRWRHEVPLLWRCVHQVHHSPERIEIITSFYKHPLEVVLNGLLSSFLLYAVVGVGPVAAAYAVLLTGLAELVYHWNVHTPYWLGFIFQRPESHCVHHQRKVHSFNFADLPLWDLLFGTFRNPRHWQESCGFGDHKERRLGEMLRGVRVS